MHVSCFHGAAYARAKTWVVYGGLFHFAITTVSVSNKFSMLYLIGVFQAYVKAQI